MTKDSKSTRPKGITNKDLQEAIAIEAADLIKEEKEKIFKRARQRIRQKFGI